MQSDFSNQFEHDKKKYGALLPKTGVYFLPDERVVNLLKIVNHVRKKCELEQKYVQANQLKMVFDNWRLQEQKRQENNMKAAQQKELITIENTQGVQFQEFTQAWDKYMSDYENTALELID